MQVIGDWAKAEFRAANKEAGKDFICYRFPGTDGSILYLTDMFAMFEVPADRRNAQLALADATMSPSFQSAFNVIKGSVPARMDVPDTDFDACGKKGIVDVKAADADLTNPLIFSDSDLDSDLDSDWPEFMSKWPRRDLSGSGGRDAAFWRSY